MPDASTVTAHFRHSWLRLAIDELRERPKGNIPALDVLRFAAVLLVLLFHVGLRFTPTYVLFGWTGVDLFFVLSGYLIGAQAVKELHHTGTIRVGRFILRRGLRIWPLYYFWILKLLAGAWFSGGDVGLEKVKLLLPDVLCISNYFGGRLLGGWSLSTEEQFYLALPVLLFAVSRWVSPRWLMILPMGWLLTLPLLRALVLREGIANVYTPLHLHSDGLALGLLIACVAVQFPEMLRLSWRRSLLMCLLVPPIALGLDYLNAVAFTYTCWTLFFGIAMVLGLQTYARTVPLLQWQGFYLLSRLSYGVYLSHQLVIGALTPLAQRFLGTGFPGYVVWSAVVSALSMGVAFLTFAAIEAPFLRIRARWLSIERTKAAAMVAT